MKLFISPHDDDHALFGAFTCLREHPILVVVFDGHVQAARGCKVTAEERARETERAALVLGCPIVIRLGFSDADPGVTPADVLQAINMKTHGERVDYWYLPADEVDGHAQHNMVAQITPVRNCTRYLTYTKHGKSTSENKVKIEHGSYIGAKLRALSMYESQMQLDPRMGCWPHFLRSQEEYYA